MAKSARPPTPCIDVCKFRRGGHCIGCSMTKDQKAAAKALKKPRHRRAFVALVRRQQDALGGYAHWLPAYRSRLRRKTQDEGWLG